MSGDHERIELERLVFFSDAVFAIAITLLVIEVKVPELAHFDNASLAQALVDQYPKYIGFLSSFFVIGRFWVAHHRVFGLLETATPKLIWTNLVFLMTIAFMPFPTAVFSEYVQLRAGVGLYTGWLIFLGLMNMRVIRVALAGQSLVRADVTEAECRQQRVGSWIPLLIGVTAFALGMILPVLSLVGLVIGSPVISFIVHRVAKPAAQPSQTLAEPVFEPDD